MTPTRQPAERRKLLTAFEKMKRVRIYVADEHFLGSGNGWDDAANRDAYRIVLHATTLLGEEVMGWRKPR